jgi:hypothetical protein
MHLDAQVDTDNGVRLTGALQMQVIGTLRNTRRRVRFAPRLAFVKFTPRILSVTRWAWVFRR